MRENADIAKDILEHADANVKAKALDAIALLEESPKTPQQLFLFEDFQDYNLKTKKAKTDAGLTVKQEAAAQLLALGFPKTQTYLLTHPEAKQGSKNSLWVRACKFCNNAKIGLRVEDLKKASAGQALMPVTKAYQKLSDLAENAVKEEVRRASLVDILKIHGVFKDTPPIGVDIRFSFDREDADV